MQPQLAYDAHDEDHATAATHELEEPGDEQLVRSFMDEMPPPPNTGFEGEGAVGGVSGIEAKRPRAGTDLPGDADADLVLLAIQKREQRAFALKFTTLLGAFALAAYLVGSGNGAILQSVIHLAVGAAAGGAAVFAWQRRQGRP